MKWTKDELDVRSIFAATIFPKMLINVFFSREVNSTQQKIFHSRNGGTSATRSSKSLYNLMFLYKKLRNLKRKFVF